MQDFASLFATPSTVVMSNRLQGAAQPLDLRFQRITVVRQAIQLSVKLFGGIVAALATLVCGHGMSFGERSVEPVEVGDSIPPHPIRPATGDCVLYVAAQLHDFSCCFHEARYGPLLVEVSASLLSDLEVPAPEVGALLV